jgi:hypothetical protein
MHLNNNGIFYSKPARADIIAPVMEQAVNKTTDVNLNKKLLVGGISC